MHSYKEQWNKHQYKPYDFWENCMFEVPIMKIYFSFLKKKKEKKKFDQKHIKAIYKYEIGEDSKVKM